MAAPAPSPAPAPVHVLKSNKCSSPSGHNSALLMPPLQDLINHKDFFPDTSVARLFESKVFSHHWKPYAVSESHRETRFHFLMAMISSSWSLPKACVHRWGLIQGLQLWCLVHNLVFTTIVKCFGCIIAVLQTTVGYDGKVIVWKLSFLHRLQLEWFLQRLTRNSTSIVTALWSNCACNWNNRSQFHKHKCV